MAAENETWQILKELFDGVSEESKMQHNETILFMQYWKLVRHCDETREEGMGQLRVNATECK